MPEVDVTASTELENALQRSSRLRKNIPEFYGTRVLLAANLASLMAELHRLGHFMIDMKPVNMRFYPDAWYMAILDTDGFSINGKHRIPALQYSDEYIAPEARSQGPERLGLEQDLFALGVIIFRLMNNGIHPFQGVDVGNLNHPTTLQDRVLERLYAYGLNSHASVKPTPSSLHNYFELSTRQLFDRAFLNPASRPSASEWRNHLEQLITGQMLVVCASKPKEHAHFSAGCGLCALNSRTAAARSSSLTVQQTQRTFQSSGNVLQSLPIASVHARTVPLGTPPASPLGSLASKPSRWRRYFAGAIFAFIAIVGLSQ